MSIHDYEGESWEPEDEGVLDALRDKAAEDYYDALEAASGGLPAVVRGPLPAATTPSLIAELDQALVLLDDYLPNLVGHPDVQVTAHQRLTDLRRNIAIVTDRIESMLLDEMPERVNRNGRTVKDRLEIPGVGVVEPNDKGGRWTDIDYQAALVAVLKALGIRGLVDGEVLEPSDLADAIAGMFSFSGLRSDKRKGTGLASVGLDREMFGVYREGTPGVRIIPNEVTP